MIVQDTPTKLEFVVFQNVKDATKLDFTRIAELIEATQKRVLILYRVRNAIYTQEDKAVYPAPIFEWSPMQPKTIRLLHFFLFYSPQMGRCALARV